ncbi:MAG: 6-phosphogluconolactonase [Actinomycetota bacterium]
MGSFKGIVTHQTVSDEDFEKIMSMPSEDIGKWANVGVDIVKDQHSVYKKMARSIADTVIANNRKGQDTRMILPVGPTPQYPMLADILNSEQVDLSRLWIFFMDEYLDWEGRLIAEDNPMSFRGYMKEALFGRLDKSLGLKDENIIFPDPANLDWGTDKIEQLGGIDVCYGGLGYHGHIAFNEPYDTYYRRMSIEKFLNSKNRVVELNSDTFVINSLCGIGGNCYGLPPKAATIGMKPIIEAKRIEIYCDGGDLNWQLASFRIACMHPPTLDRPATLLQLHSNAREAVLFVADEITASPIKVAPK